MPDALVSDITVVAEDLNREDMIDVARKLEAVGLRVDEINHESGVIEGTINTDKLPDVHKVDGVKYVRIELTYVADYPYGDPRNVDPPDA